MEQLTSKDLDGISQFLRVLYAEVQFERLPKVMLEGLARLIPCEHNSYNEIDSLTNAAIMHTRPVLTTITHLAPVLEAHLSEHPQLTYYRNNPDRTPYQFTDFISHQQFQELPIYRDFYRHFDTENQLTCVLSDHKATCDVGIAINRHHCDFEDRDQAVLEFLRPHLIQARKNALVFTEVERKTQTLNAAVDKVRLGVLTLGQEGDLTWATNCAIGFLERYFPDSLKSTTRLPDLLNRWVRECRSRLASGLVTPELMGCFTVSIGGFQLKVQYTPGRDGSDRLLFTEHSTSTPIQTTRFGLTARESEVIHWIVEGKTNPEIGIILGTSPRTIHKHVERIFSKLNVQTRAAAVREVLSSP